MKKSFTSLKHTTRVSILAAGLLFSGLAESNDFKGEKLGQIRASMIEFKEVSAKLFAFAFGGTVTSAKATPESENQPEKKRDKKNENEKEKATELEQNSTLALLERLNNNVGVASHQNLFQGNPVAEVTFGVLKQTLNESVASYKRGHTELARDLLRASFHSCLTCHSSGLSKVKFSFGDTEEISKTLPPGPSVAKLYFAFREFDKVESYGEKSLQEVKIQMSKETSGDFKNADLLEVTSTLELALTSFILQEKQPKEILERLQNWQVGLPPASILFLKNQEWIAELKRWESKVAKLGPKALSDLGFLEKQLGLEKNEKLLQTGANFVTHLYIKQALTNLAFEKGSKPARTGKILHLLGLIYTAHDNTLFLGLGDAYFVSCISRFKHTLEAERCYGALKASVELESTGTAGLALDPEDVALLEKLRADASPKKLRKK